MRKAASIISWLVGIGTSIWGIVAAAQGIDVPVQVCRGYGYGCSITVQHQASPGWLWALLIVAIVVRLIILIWRENAIASGKKIGCGVCTLIFVSVIGGILTLCIPEDELGDEFDDIIRETRSSSGASYYDSQEDDSPYYRPDSPYERYGPKSTPKPTKKPTVQNGTFVDDGHCWLTQEQRDREVEDHRTLFKKGIITEEEFDRRVAELDARVVKPEEAPNDEESPSPKAPAKKRQTKASPAAQNERFVDDGRCALTPEQRDHEVNDHRTLLKKGIISQEEFDRRVAELDARVEKPPVDDTQEGLGEFEKADLILKYNQMYEAGILTKEEFEKKKKELLK